MGVLSPFKPTQMIFMNGVRTVNEILRNLKIADNALFLFYRIAGNLSGVLLANYIDNNITKS